ncbi:SDR family NAD(P)-dependent oxidoreductase [Bradyrhizobium sp. RDM4]|uniref:SDR family NAD(P)-dependent oxidoreductase n=1 Tax=Bradyrhizobium sp. RDM4 TaxID=3378765 RepID=UPI0038FD2D71
MPPEENHIKIVRQSIWRRKADGMTNTADLFSMSARVVLITGGAGAHGRIYARTLADLGASVVLADINGAAAEQVAAELIAQGGGDISGTTVDITDTASVARAASEVDTRYGRLDVLINNAGIVSSGAFTHDVTLEDWTRVISVNLTGAFLMIRGFMPLLHKSKSASIINNGSMLGLVGLHPGFPMVSAPYAAAKAGLFGLTRQVAADYAARGIRCNAIAPGWHGGSGIQRSIGMPQEAFDRSRRW